MVKLHLKRLASPKTWPIPKKTLTYVARPFPGPHKIENQLPISVFMRDVVGLVSSQKEVKYVLHNKDCLIDGAVCHDNKRPVGLFDTVSFPKAKKFYRVVMTTKYKLSAVEVSETEALVKVSKITGKQSLKGGKTQITTFDGRTVLVDDASKYVVGDSLVLDVPGQKITDHLSFQPKATVFLIAGSAVGVTGTVEEIDGNILVVKSGDDVFKTKKSYAIVVGKEKPIITLK